METPDTARETLRQLLTRRGWAVSDSGTSLTAHKHDWPAQLRLVLDPGSATEPAMMGITVDFRSMPLGGERLRDIFNMEREQLMRALGSFRVRQMSENGWTTGISDRVFLHGVDGGILRSAEVVLFDRCPDERGEQLVERFSLESSRLLETGGEIASLLQRTYHRTVLRNHVPVSSLPALVVPAAVNSPQPAAAETSYPWRR